MMLSEEPYAFVRRVGTRKAIIMAVEEMATVKSIQALVTAGVIVDDRNDLLERVLNHCKDVLMLAIPQEDDE